MADSCFGLVIVFDLDDGGDTLLRKLGFYRITRRCNLVGTIKKKEKLRKEVTMAPIKISSGGGVARKFPLEVTFKPFNNDLTDCPRVYCNRDGATQLTHSGS
jgi:hypothetical protein